MANLKEIKRRIGSVKKTRQITSAMKLVATAKLRRAKDAATSAKPYQKQLADLLSRVASKVGDDSENPLLASRAEVHKRLLVVITSDRGLCGPFNNALLRKTGEFVGSNGACDVIAIGKKARNYMQSNDLNMLEAIVDYSKTPKMEMVIPLCETLVSGFVDGTYDEIYVVYNQFVNAIVQTPTFSKILPMRVETTDDAAPSDSAADYVYEPSAEAVLAQLLPLYLENSVLGAFLQTEAGEHAARMTAMDNATKNSSELIDNLTLEFNRARQAAITTELTEIVSGAEAL
jgi:F-type H+-transporting ATPase subunit gamma